MRYPSKLLPVVFLATALAIVSSRPAAADTPGAPSLAVGDTVPAFDAEGIDGVTKHVSYPKGSATVLVFFLSGCPTCHKMIPEWNRAFDRRPKGLEVVGVILDRETPGFWMATPISFPVVRSPGKEFSETFKISKVPMTLRVGPGGKVVSVNQGLVDPIRLGEIFSK